MLRPLLILLACAWSWCASAATNIAASASSTDIQAAINLCSFTALDTVQVPAGTNNWTSVVTTGGRSINIVGVGWNTATTTTIGFGSGGNFYFDIPLYKTNFVFISGIAFSNLSSMPFGGPAFYGADGTLTGRRFRITNCRVTPFNGSDRGLMFREVRGLCDHVYFRMPWSASAHAFDVAADGNTYASVTNWQIGIKYGDTNTVVIEDCTFDFDHLGDDAFDAYAGQKFTVRYCHFTNTVPGWHGADSEPRGVREFEIYMCDFHSKNGFTLGYGALARSGSGVIFSNTWDAGWNGAVPLYMRQYRASGNYDGSQGLNTGNPPGTFLPAGGLQGPMNGARIVDGNFDGSGWPGLDQIGRGSFTNNPVTWTATFTAANYEQAEGVYLWGNNVNGNTSPLASAGGFNNEPIPLIIAPNRDYFDNTVKPGYVPEPYPDPLIAATTPPPQRIAQVTKFAVTGTTKIGP